ncbi:MAG: thiamine pyrophosphate-binding protein, partial [Chloroflexi bacterium]|nr:thiamine pyrophosphate-binding protein [Chloroflexota bacterium]
HESVAGFMADAYFRISHVPVATFTSCGPGSANQPVALASAFMDSSAFLAITGNVPTSQWNRGPFQETGRHVQGDVINALRPYVKRSFQPTRPEMLPLALKQAYATMLSGRPGPVHLDVPLDLFVEQVDDARVATEFASSAVPSRAAADPELVADALRRLRVAKRPVIVAGHGVEGSEAERELAALAERVAVPVAVTPLGKGVMDMRSRFCLGSTGRNGTYPANAATRNADVILAIGTRFDDRATSSWLPGFTYRIPPTELIQIDIDPAEIGRNYPVAVPLLGDARTVLRQLLTATEEAPRDERREWWERIERWRARWSAHLSGAGSSDARPIRPERVVREVREALPDDGVLLADVGVHHNWIVAEFEARRHRSVLQSWGFASMGFGVAGALGAKLAAPDRPVLSVCGDGGFLMTASAVATAVEYGIPVVWLVWNNLGYCSIRDQQRGYFGADRELATSFVRADDGELTSVDFATLARSMGAEGARVEAPGDLGGRLRWALGLGRPVVLDVRVDRDVRPPATASWDLPPLP